MPIQQKQNCHRVFSNDDQGYWYKLRPTEQQVQTLRVCQEKIRDCLTQALFDEYKVKPKFRVQGSWAYGTCNQPAQADQEMDLDYGAYLPSDVFSDGRSTEEAKLYFNVAKKALTKLCDEENWELNDKKNMCLRIHKVMSNAHIDVPLYAVPDDMFEDLVENHRVAFDSVHKAEASVGLFRATLESFNGEMLTESVRIKEIEMENIQMIHMAHQNGEWKPSDCEKVREWFLRKCAIYPNKGSQLKAIVRYLKGWRDQEWQTGGPTSILLMMIAVQKYVYVQGRDDKALWEVTKELARSLLEDVFVDDLADHEVENFNKSNTEQRAENAAKAARLHKLVEQSMQAHQPQQSIDCLKISFGDRIPNDTQLVSAEQRTPSSDAIHQTIMSQPAQRAKEAAAIPPQIGG